MAKAAAIRFIRERWHVLPRMQNVVAELGETDDGARVL